MVQSLDTLLAHGSDQLGLSLEPEQRAQLLEYLTLLARWNRAYNLTAVRDERHMVTRHLLDSIAVSPFLSGKRFIDVGTGPGLPGLPLAIIHPRQNFHLLDSGGKKTRFLFQVKTALCLDNIVVHQARAEAFQADQPYDAVLSRAFASLQAMAAMCRHLLAVGGRFLAMKGAFPARELDHIRRAYSEIKVHSLDIPGLAEQRHLVEIALPQDT
ncbi:MAG: 16S rRNA (guanine(527)-N(7))-methyltransferase RsmG [Halioglobus sp.]|nr:16S rRNA (guanine(527)-N(7))-methyltransferase RsmG [Halioglobus sp.]